MNCRSEVTRLTFFRGIESGSQSLLTSTPTGFRGGWVRRALFSFGRSTRGLIETGGTWFLLFLGNDDSDQPTLPAAGCPKNHRHRADVAKPRSRAVSRIRVKQGGGGVAI